MSVPMTWSDLERQNASGPAFPSDLHTYTCTNGQTAITFGMVTRVGRVVFVAVRLHYPKARGPQHIQILGLPH